MKTAFHNIGKTISNNGFVPDNFTNYFCVLKLAILAN